MTVVIDVNSKEGSSTAQIKLAVEEVMADRWGPGAYEIQEVFGTVRVYPPEGRISQEAVAEIIENGLRNVSPRGEVHLR
jgi:hypothetical protein